MRKLLLILLICCLLCGCSAKKSAKPVLTGISFTAQMHYYGNKYKCDCISNRDGTLTVRVLSPENLSPLAFVFDGNGVTARYDGLSYYPQLEQLPVGAAARDLYGILHTTTTAEYGKKNGQLNGKTDGRAFRLNLSPTGLPLDAEFSDGSRIIFGKVTVINKKTDG